MYYIHIIRGSDCMTKSASKTSYHSSPSKKPLDNEWVELMLMAKKSGITVEQIRTYMSHKKEHTLNERHR